MTWSVITCAHKRFESVLGPCQDIFTFLLVPMNQPGIEVRPIRTMAGSSEFAEVFFDDVHVPAGRIVGVRVERNFLARATDKTWRKAKAKQPAKKKSPATKAPPGNAPLSKLSISDLQAMYVATVGRPTRSKNANYLIWKIRQAEQGKIPVGPTRRRSSTNPGAYKVIPLRMETEVVYQIDAARERGEIRNLRAEAKKRGL